jgi:hypothetical protein
MQRRRVGQFSSFSILPDEGNVLKSVQLTLISLSLAYHGMLRDDYLT